MNEFEELEVLYENDVLQARIGELANQINKHYQNRDIVFICVLKGSIFFTADLMRKIDIKNNKVDLEFMKIKSYEGTETNGDPKIQDDIKTDIEGRDVIIVEDIIDTGLTLEFIVNELSKRNPKSIKTCALFDKYEKRVNGMQADYVGFKIDNFFVLGYGFDEDEKYRTLPCVCRKKILQKTL